MKIIEKINKMLAYAVISVVIAAAIVGVVYSTLVVILGVTWDN